MTCRPSWRANWAMARISREPTRPGRAGAGRRPPPPRAAAATAKETRTRWPTQTLRGKAAGGGPVTDRIRPSEMADAKASPIADGRARGAVNAREIPKPLKMAAKGSSRMRMARPAKTGAAAGAAGEASSRVIQRRPKTAAKDNRRVRTVKAASKPARTAGAAVAVSAEAKRRGRGRQCWTGSIAPNRPTTRGRHRRNRRA